MKTKLLLTILNIFSSLLSFSQINDTSTISLQQLSPSYNELMKMRSFYAYPVDKWDSLRCVWYNECQTENNSVAKYVTTCSLNKRMFGWHIIGTSSSSYSWNSISDLSYFAYDVDPSTGNANNSSQIANWSTDATVVAAHTNGVHVNLCAVLSSGYSTFFTNTTAQTTLINNLVNAVIAANANGVNIDFEGTSILSTYKTQFITFMSNLSTQLHNAVPNSELSMDFMGGWGTYSSFITQLNPYVDLFILMGYDYYWPGQGTPGPVAPLYNFYSGSFGSVSKSINDFLQIINPDKFILAMPYYGYRWGVSNGSTLPGVGSGSSSIGTQTYAQYIQNSNGYYSNPQRDGYTFNAYNCFTDGNSVPNQQFIDDVFSLQKKYDVAKQRGIAGVAVWRLGYDAGYSDLWNLIDNNISSCEVVPTSGTIYDMGGPNGDYHNKEHYSFTIAPPSATSVTLTFISFNIETGYDYLKVYVPIHIRAE
jgi:spore germination protein YaaH